MNTTRQQNIERLKKECTEYRENARSANEDRSPKGAAMWNRKAREAEKRLFALLDLESAEKVAQ